MCYDVRQKKRLTSLKRLFLKLVGFSVAAGCADIHQDGDEALAEVEVRQIEPSDSEILREWERVTDDDEILGVSVSLGREPEWKWQVCVAVAEFVRDEPLESNFSNRITLALGRVKGVKEVIREDREVWLVDGEPDGEELVREVSAALDAMEEDLREYLKTL